MINRRLRHVQDACVDQQRYDDSREEVPAMEMEIECRRSSKNRPISLSLQSRIPAGTVESSPFNVMLQTCEDANLARQLFKFAGVEEELAPLLTRFKNYKIATRRLL